MYQILRDNALDIGLYLSQSERLSCSNNFGTKLGRG